MPMAGGLGRLIEQLAGEALSSHLRNVRAHSELRRRIADGQLAEREVNEAYSAYARGNAEPYRKAAADLTLRYYQDLSDLSAAYSRDFYDHVLGGTSNGDRFGGPAKGNGDTPRRRWRTRTDRAARARRARDRGALHRGEHRSCAGGRRVRVRAVQGATWRDLSCTDHRATHTPRAGAGWRGRGLPASSAHALGVPARSHLPPGHPRRGRQAIDAGRELVGRLRGRRRARGRSRPLGRRAPMANPDEPAPVPRTSRPKKAAPRARSVSSSATASTASTTEPAKPKGKAAKPKTVAAKPKAEAAGMAPRRAASARRTRPGST